MKGLLRHYLTISLSIFLLTLFIPSFKITGNWQGFFLSTAIFTLLYYLLRPIINLILIPINILTLGLSMWIINIFVVFLWSLLSKNVHVGPWNAGSLNLGAIHVSNLSFPGWAVVILIGIFLTLVVQFLDWILN